MTSNRTLKFVATATTVLGLFVGSTALASAATGQPAPSLATSSQIASVVPHTHDHV